MEHISFLANNNLSNAKYHKVYTALFGCVPGKPGTLTHELEHARRKASSEAADGGVHTSASINGKDEEFNVCANHFARMAIDAGCLDAWKKSVKEAVMEAVMEAVNSKSDALEKGTLDTLRELERIDKKQLMEKLGFEEIGRAQ